MEMTKTLTDKGNESAVINSTTYTFSNGRPVSINYENIANPEYNSNKIFQYDENDRVIAELEGGETVQSVAWDGEVATLINSDGNAYGEAELEDGNVIRYTTLGEGESISTFYSHDADGNVIAVESPEGELLREFLSFNIEKTHPTHLLKSIAPIRITSAPFFTHIYETMRVQPIEGDDFSTELTDYTFEYTFDENGRVKTIEDNLSAIYTTWYQYL